MIVSGVWAKRPIRLFEISYPDKKQGYLPLKTKYQVFKHINCITISTHWVSQLLGANSVCFKRVNCQQGIGKIRRR
jgi:hypothetical protein